MYIVPRSARGGCVCTLIKIVDCIVFYCIVFLFLFLLRCNGVDGMARSDLPFFFGLARKDKLTCASGCGPVAGLWCIKDVT